jgi:hypothetical protein
LDFVGTYVFSLGAGILGESLKGQDFLARSIALKITRKLARVLSTNHARRAGCDWDTSLHLDF